ncbi:hypothetical protein BaRGS_00003289 [Batillaria attramentaria]|uniref:NTR domain-containing protein n=1 Tax=Batillaria attramentaria TaxID=370345 RepID=A0ABD0M1F0_9CAEN
MENHTHTSARCCNAVQSVPANNNHRTGRRGFFQCRGAAVDSRLQQHCDASHRRRACQCPRGKEVPVRPRKRLQDELSYGRMTTVKSTPVQNLKYYVEATCPCVKMQERELSAFRQSVSGDRHFLSLETSPVFGTRRVVERDSHRRKPPPTVYLKDQRLPSPSRCRRSTRACSARAPYKGRSLACQRRAPRPPALLRPTRETSSVIG